MSYSLDFAIALGVGNTGLLLQAQLVNSSGNPVGGVVTSGFTEIGVGNYLWAGTIPDGFQGGVIFSQQSGPVEAFIDVNPPPPPGPVELAPDALDNIMIEAGVSASQALAIIAAVLAGQLQQTCSISGPGTVTFSAVDNPTITRVTAQVLNGNRIQITLNLP
jgi:hypothetical protein